MRRLVLAGAVLLMAMLAFAFVGCKDDKKDNNGTTPTTEATVPADTTPAGTTPTAGETPGATSQPGAFTTVVATENPTLGTILTTFDGFTVYTFDSDTGGTPTCTGDCANTWQPLPSAGDPTGGEGVPGTLDLVARDDGSMQVTYDGKPLYLYSGDPAAGDTNGDGFGGVWHVVVLG